MTQDVRKPEAGRTTRETLTTALVLLGSGVVVVTCSATREREVETPRGVADATRGTPATAAAASAPGAAGSTAPRATASTSAAPVASATASAPPAVATALAPAPPRPGVLPLPRFYAAANALAAGTRQDHVRVVWLGDSHTAADLWTGAVRSRLVAKLGSGGPGFVHAGWGDNKYRHEGVRVDTVLKWSIAPVPYPKTKREDDGVFGLGGVRLSPVEGDARASVEVLSSGAPRGEALTWDVAYREGDGAGALRAHLGGAETLLRPTDDEPGPGGIRHHKLRSAGNAGKLELSIASGRPQLFGVVVEGDKPGLVLDTVGLNGARLATFLAWEPDAWSAELARRKPELVVIAFGTNESSDVDPKPERYEGQLVALVGRIRRGAPEADCLVVLPMDRGGTEFKPRLAAITRGLEAGAKKLSCATWSALGAMGGPGSMEAWSHESPPRSGADGVHLTPKGYAYLGERLAKDLIEGLGGAKNPL